MSNPNANKIKKLKEKRKWMKGTITRIKTLVEDPDTEWTLTKVNSKIRSLKDAMLTYVENYDAIVDLVDNDEELAEYGNDIETETQLVEEIFDKLDEVKLLFIPADNPETSRSASPIVNPCNHGHVSSVKLPKLDFASFTGNYRDWNSFVDIFNATVHINTTLSDVTKLQYLLSKLADEPKKLLSNIKVTDGNYAVAWDLLKNRYDNKKVILFEHLSTLFSLPSAQENSASGLKKLMDMAVHEIRALEGMGFKLEDNSYADLIIAFTFLKKLDCKTYELWNMASEAKEIPKWDDLIKFVEKRCFDLESREKPGQHNGNASNKGKNSYLNVDVSKKCCILCPNVFHPLFKCSKFNKLTVANRKATVQQHKLCFNCLQPGHQINNCRSNYKCKHCGRKHSSSLHEERQTTSKPEPAAQLGAHVGNQSGRNSMVLLATAVVRVKDSKNRFVNCRVLLDQGSQVNVISEECINRLGLKRKHSNVTLTGLGENNINNVKGETGLNLKSMYGNFNLIINALIMSNVTSLQPSVSLVPSWRWKHLHEIPLADPNYFRPGRIDILLGAGHVGAILRGEVRRGQDLAPVAQDTELGWVLFGEVQASQQPIQGSHHLSILHVNSALEHQLKKFWELEEEFDMPACKLTEEEKTCEEFFASTHSRDQAGRFIVRIPFKESTMKLGNSRKIAFSRQMQIERKLEKNSSQKIEYVKFMQEYEMLNHMKDVSFLNNLGANFLPHHYVEKESTTTKLRVVFDASAKTESGKSFNSIQITGPNLQGSIVEKFIRWRFHLIPIVADVAKMYRQILLHPEDRKHQHILWRSEPGIPMKEFELNTVTYGTASAPYLAMKCLQQLALDEAKEFPLGSIVTLEDSYMDDIVTGAQTLEEAAKLQDQLINLYNAGGFQLRKFMSSEPHLINRIPAELRAVDSDSIFESDENYKTLGISWDYVNDNFYFKDLQIPSRRIYTKRTIASDVAKTFDPLGWMAPFFIQHKILLQKLWSLKCDWDQPVPDAITEEWNGLRVQMGKVNSVRINRCVLRPNYNNLEFHGFSDASEVAYSAVVYLVCTGSNGLRHSSLLIAKTKVAPLKHVSIPKLELCGAVLLGKLLRNVVSALKTKRKNYQFNYSIHTWTDSSIVLAWLASPSRTWKTFIANRVAKVQTMLPDVNWNYVKSAENPADCASRGLVIEDLVHFKLWWEGPSWLKLPVGIVDPPSPDFDIVLAEEKKHVVLNVTEEDSLLSKFSTLGKLIGVTAFIFRFYRNCKSSVGSRTTEKFLSADERRSALELWISKVQFSSFGEEMDAIRHGKPVTSSIKTFLPFLDEKGILRVGGRLEKAKDLPYPAKHPILLPKNHILSSLLIADFHHKNLHAGQTLTLASVRQEYWILGARSMITTCIKKCVTCVRHRSSNPQPQMGDLPSSRITPSHTFQHTGTDFAGPILVRSWSGRGRKSVKAYICVFICFATKAIHLELVSELSTSAFLAALDRFVSIRGKPNIIYSDNGSNYVGAERELRVFYDYLQESQAAIGEHLSKESITWSFSPPHAPHFGGLWESAVKSAKFHLKRVLGANSFTVEEITTLLAKVGACLNSRPLCPMSNQPDDLECLTPGHFLIGRPLNAIPHPDLSKLKWNSLDRWQKVQQVNQLFWEKWSREYLTELQRRSKWCKDQENVKVGDMVLLKEDFVQPAKWRMGRITEAVPGGDGKVRVVNVRTASGVLKRPVVKICLLPIRSNAEEEQI